MGAATLVLAVTALVATKANNKRFVNSFATAITLGNAVRVIAPTNVFTTANTGHRAFLATAAGGTLKTLVTIVNRSKIAYFK